VPGFEHPFNKNRNKDVTTTAKKTLFSRNPFKLSSIKLILKIRNKNLPL
jgi:hypothetical protein